MNDGLGWENDYYITFFNKAIIRSHKYIFL